MLSHGLSPLAPGSAGFDVVYHNRLRGGILHREKFGWQAHMHGANMAFAFKSAFYGSDGTAVSVFLGYVKGRGGFGKALLSCLQGCTCPEPLHIDADNPLNSTVRFHALLSASLNCHWSVDRTGAGELYELQSSCDCAGGRDGRAQAGKPGGRLHPWIDRWGREHLSRLKIQSSVSQSCLDGARPVAEYHAP
jgi:hypothetical protein